ncbi:MAG: CoA-binding protein [Candidatus Peribacteria bacterium]|jgi:predicted CoA-binding protein|nr:CoA-binding protein [Candidatus Peribacteria bacterium]
MFISKSYTYALIGASHNPDKYGHIILKDFITNGYHIIPVNPHNEDTIEGLTVYKNLTEIGEPIDVVIFVVQPEVVLSILPLVKEKGISKVRMQTGSGSDEAIKFCEDNNIQYGYNTCIMVQRRLEESQQK